MSLSCPWDICFPSSFFPCHSQRPLFLNSAPIHFWRPLPMLVALCSALRWGSAPLGPHLWPDCSLTHFRGLSPSLDFSSPNPRYQVLGSNTVPLSLSAPILSLCSFYFFTSFQGLRKLPLERGWSRFNSNLLASFISSFKPSIFQVFTFQP